MEATNAVTKQMKFYEDLYYVCNMTQVSMEETLKRLIGPVLVSQLDEYHYLRLTSTMKAVYYTNTIKYCKLGEHLEFVADLDVETVDIMETTSSFDTVYTVIMNIFNFGIIDNYCSGLDNLRCNYHEIIDNIRKIKRATELSFVHSGEILEAMTFSDRICGLIGHGVPRYDTFYSIVKGTPYIIHQCVNELDDIEDVATMIRSISYDLDMLIDIAYNRDYGAKLKYIYSVLGYEYEFGYADILDAFSGFEENFEKLMKLFNVKNHRLIFNSIWLCDGYDIMSSELKSAVENIRSKKYNNDTEALINAAYMTKLINVRKLENFSRMMYSKIRFIETIASEYRRFHDGFITYFTADYSSKLGFEFNPVTKNADIVNNIPADFVNRCIDMYWLNPLNVALGCSNVEEGFKLYFETPLIELNVVFNLLDEYDVSKREDKPNIIEDTRKIINRQVENQPN